jgi:hypothetical protein
MLSFLSIEILFWLPTLLDLALLVITYGYCRWYGVEWYLKQTESKNEDNGPLSKRDKNLWDFAMMAYSAYGVLLPLCFYWCYNFPEFRTSFCWAMTFLMVSKILHIQKTEGDALKSTFSLYFFYIPTYGGYALYKTFFSS